MRALLLFLLVPFIAFTPSLSQDTGSFILKINGKAVAMEAVKSLPFCLTAGDSLRVEYAPAPGEENRTFVVSGLGLFGQLNLTAPTNLMMLKPSDPASRPGFTFTLKDHIPFELAPEGKIVRVVVRAYEVYETQNGSPVRKFTPRNSEFSFLMVKKC